MKIRFEGGKINGHVKTVAGAKVLAWSLFAAVMLVTLGLAAGLLFAAYSLLAAGPVVLRGLAIVPYLLACLAGVYAWGQCRGFMSRPWGDIFVHEGDGL